MAPARRGHGPVFWVLIVLGGILVLGLAGAVGTGLFIFNKARQAGVDPEMWRTDPGLAIARMIAATHPDAEIVRTNRGDRTVTLRDRRTGKEATMSFDELRSGKLRFTAEGEDGKVASIEIGGTSRLPSWIPSYPNTSAKPVFSVKGETDESTGEAGTFTFTTDDAPDEVVSFYQEKARQLGMQVELRARSDNAGTVVGTDEDGRRTLTVVVAGSRPATVTVTYSRKM